jgi:uncharacterized membrane protein YkoI
MKHARDKASGCIAKAGMAFAIFAGLTFGTASLLRADDDDKANMTSQDQARDMLRDRVRRGEIKSLADLRDTVMTKVPGEIVSTSVDQENGATVYDFRILNSANRLVEVEVDAASGVILEIENDE